MIKRILLGIFATLLLLIAGSIILVGTPFGLDTAVYLAGKLTHQRLQIINTKGSLLTDLSADQIRYIDKQQRLEIDQFKLNWRAIHLLIKHLDIHLLSANKVTYAILKDSSDNTKAPSLSLPVDVTLKKLSIHHLTYYDKPAQQTYQLDNTQLQAIINKKRLAIAASSNLSTPYKASAKLTIIGQPDQYQLHSKITSPLITSHISGKGNLKSIHLNINESSALGGHLSGTASVQWLPKLKVTSKLTAKRLQLGNHWISGIINANYNDLKHFTINTKLNTSLGHINIVGHHKEDWNLNWDVDLKHLERLSPLLLGSIQGKGSVQGDTHLPVIQGRIQLKKIVFKKQKLDHLDAQWNIYTNEKQPSNITVHAKKIIAPGVEVKQVQFNATGTLEKHQAQLSMDTSLGKLAMLLNGQYAIDTQQWKGQVPSLTLDGQALDHWKLNHPIKISYSPQQQIIQPFCWISAKAGKLCFSGSQQNNHWKSQLNAQLNLGLLRGLKLEGLSFSGQLNTAIRAQGDQSGPSSINANINAKQLQARIGNGALLKRLKFNKANANITLQNGLLNWQQIISTTSGDRLTVNLKAKGVNHFNSDINPTLDGELNITVKKLQEFNNLLPMLVTTSGLAKLNTAITGKWLNPKIKTILDLTKATINFPDLGIALTRGLLVGHTTKSNLNYSFKIFSNNQPLRADGSLNLKNYSLDGSSRLYGKNIPVINNLDFSAIASPDISIKIKDKNINVTGKITIPRAMLQPKAFNSTVTLPTSDIIYINETPAIPSAWKTYLNVDVIVGNDVKVSSFGASGNVVGKLSVFTKPGETLLGNGKLELKNGKFDAHGAKLDITHASAVFRNSPTDNPALNITATRTINTYSSAGLIRLGIENLTVGIRFTGYAKNPKLSLFSTPVSLNETDILSYLILGHSSGGGSGVDLAILINAFNSGNGGRISDFVGNLTKGLGLSELGIQSETAMDIAGNPIDSQNSFVIGKYITPKVYLRYSRGLVDDNNTILLRYMITPKWAIQTEQSYLGTGVDVLYTFYQH